MMILSEPQSLCLCGPLMRSDPRAAIQIAPQIRYQPAADTA
jgi:hypothetical protein